MQNKTLRTAFFGGIIALALTGCAPVPPEPSPSATQASPPAPSSLPTPAPDAADAAVDVQVDTMTGIWDGATATQREQALIAIGLDPANPEPTDETVSALVSQAAEYGYEVSDDAARAFLAQISAQ